MKSIYIYDALRIMRKLSAENVPFSMEFISCDRTRENSQGLVTVNNAFLSKGLRRDQSEYWENLIAYENLETGQNRNFWLPLLMKFNGIKVTFKK